MFEENPHIQKLEAHAEDIAHVYADMVFSTDGTQGLNNLATMPFAEVARVVRNLIDDARQDPAVGEHSIACLTHLVRSVMKDSIHDNLTGVYSRRYIEDRLETHIEEINRQPETRGAMIYIDFDKFKKLNDTHGHLAGDEALIRGAHKIAELARKSDVPARMGGDEFAVFMPDATKEEAEALTLRLRGAFDDLTFEWEGKDLPIFASIGFATIEPGQTAKQVLKGADEALYEQKALKRQLAKEEEFANEMSQILGRNAAPEQNKQVHRDASHIPAKAVAFILR